MVYILYATDKISISLSEKMDWNKPIISLGKETTVTIVPYYA
jgi:hypothetical protein